VAVLSSAPLKMSWGAVIGGVVAALGVAILLYALGLALGLNVVVDANKPESLRSSGLFTSIWMLITSLIALFVGGYVAGRGANAITHVSGSIHGLVMWGLTTVAAVWLVLNVFGSVISGVASVGKTAVEAGAGAIASGAGGARDLAKSLGFDANTALQPINDRLRAEGKPQITPQQLEAATKDVVQDAVRSGRLDRQLLVTSISQNTALSPADAEEVAGRVEDQWNTGREKLSGSLSKAGETLQTGTLKVAETTGKVFWGVFVALALGLISAVVGANMGIGRRQRLWVEHPPEGGTPIRGTLYPSTNPY
jgi:hypothetical protein